MIINLKEGTLKDIIKNGKFTCDGCACGDFTYQLNENLWLSIYRSCRKSSMTPDEKLWQLHELEFYDNIQFSYYEHEGKTYIDDVEEFGNVVENVKLNEKDEMVLYEHLKKIIKENWGNEYRNED